MTQPPTGPEIHYAKSGDVNIAYLSFGSGDLDFLLVPGFVRHLEISGELPQIQHLGSRISSFARLILFDKRGTGLSDPVTDAPTLEERMDDLRAVLDAVGSERAALFGASEGVPLALLFAATHPERVQALCLYGGMARTTWSEDHPWTMRREDFVAANEELVLPFWGQGIMSEILAPSLADDPGVKRWSARLALDD